MENQKLSPHRKVLSMAVVALCNEVGFTSVEQAALETLTEILQSFLLEAGRSSRAYCEVAGRTGPVCSDVYVALGEMGFSWEGLSAYANRPNRSKTIEAPQSGIAAKQLSILQIGDRRPHPHHIPDHLPPFPDSHSYIRTPTHKKPVTEYEEIREKSSNHKRDVERALTRFIAKTGEPQSLFHVEDNNLFPLIACQPMASPYLHALLPKDQIFDEQEDEQAAQQQQQQQPASRIKKKGSSPETESSTTVALAGGGLRRSIKDGLALISADATESQEAKDKQDLFQENEAIDNPYLRPIKMPRKSTPPR